ncbi:hypothetical protein CDO47_30295, partial [Pseudomonas aeruginosa]
MMQAYKNKWLPLSALALGMALSFGANADEHTINMQWLYSNALGGVRLQVPMVCRAEAGGSSAPPPSRQTPGTCRRPPPRALEDHHSMLMGCSAGTNARASAGFRRARASCGPRGWANK